MDRIIFGDNQFFGINHMSEEKAQAQAERFKDITAILEVIDLAWDAGVRGFMFNTHDRVAAICDHFRANPTRYADLRLYPSMPYAHKYANLVAEQGVLGAVKEVVFTDRSAGQVLSTLARGAGTLVNQNMMEVMKLLVDAEMKMFRNLNVQAVFLQNIITDLLFGLGVKQVFVEFAGYVKSRYGVDAEFNTMNMPGLVEFLTDAGIENPIVCSSINKAGFLMNPDRESYEEALATKTFRPMAMSVLASGAVPPREAIEYVLGLPNVRSIVFGASSRKNIEQTVKLINEGWSE